MKMMKVILAVMTSAVLSFTAASQDFKELVNAFDSSYLYEGKGKYEKAAEVLKRYYDAGSYEINVRLGYTTYLAGAYTESQDYYLKAINLKPYAIEPRLGYVLPAKALGNWNQVLEQYLAVLSTDPMNTTAAYQAGIIYYYREQYDVALKYFEKVANLYPFDYDNTIMYAWTRYKLGNLREARVLFEKALIMRPEDESATEGLSLIK